jgi:hypothetical protein
MEPLNFRENGVGEEDFQKWLIEDSWEGSIFLEARVIKTWQGLCGTNKLLEDREGRFFWWAVLYAPEGGLALQRIVSFLDWDSMAAELGITEIGRLDTRILASSIH